MRYVEEDMICGRKDILLQLLCTWALVVQKLQLSIATAQFCNSFAETFAAKHMTCWAKLHYYHHKKRTTALCESQPMLTGGASFFFSSVASFSLVDMANEVRDDRCATNVRGTPNPSAP